MAHKLSQTQLATEVDKGITLAQMLPSGEGVDYKEVENAPLQTAFFLGDWKHAESLMFNMTMATAGKAKRQILQATGTEEPTNAELIAWIVQDDSIAWVANERCIYLVQV